ncbi:hypothetical protein SAMN02745217_04176 [Anaerocolumna xylanovorans DSM 12503]|uniref:Uncharacterized protein n=1 Tax=Anaerocolumna xylanovorans DSM 12503 TaxID=1121345 RepID=A0A1M7YLW2_9FIRM|nr:hypothetical protein SAMN02745217_04176 [Anaerocolumna xylanovorans DSM 12503]
MCVCAFTEEIVHIYEVKQKSYCVFTKDFGEYLIKSQKLIIVKFDTKWKKPWNVIT